MHRILDRARDLLLRRRGQYRAVFETDAGKYVLGDLFHICFAGQSTYRGGRDEILINEGKRQVWLHIQSMIHSTDEELYKLARQRVELERNLSDG